MADSYAEGVLATLDGKRQQFGSRFLRDPARVFHHNAWDNVEWSEEQAAAAERKVQENSAQRVCPEKQDNKKNEISECGGSEKGPGLATEKQRKCSCGSLRCKAHMPPVEENVTQKLSHLEICADAFPGSSATYRILEVGCGVGNTVFPILQTNNNPGVFIYCCDFSSLAIELVRTNSEYDPSRCFAFVHNLCDEDQSYPVPWDSLDVIVLIFVLSAIVPDKMQGAINRLSRLLKPGGVMLLRDYGRYDMAQLRFKNGQCLSGNFYVRGDGTRVYFFTQDELDILFTTAGLEKVQNLVDRRLQVNRGKQLTMYRVWIQCKYRKPLVPSTS
ncbi:methyltransferase-like protein 2A isoform X2 [Nannospalax galili]|uniref:methyltransferase-like protein 2A isoform X2 n=1 Tax=Nannospalax galili TaxID=1026970 RepID=UPI0004ED2099|nr:methyltransferase-like protein 2A isoform X2 [Nannospalax galili]